MRHRVLLYNVIAGLMVVYYSDRTSVTYAIEADAPHRDPKDDFERAIVSMATSNPKAELIKTRMGSLPIFDKNYDWSEPQRISRVMHRLHADAEPAWVALVNGLANDEYAVTFQYFRTTTNATIGDLCQRVIVRQLTAAYREHIPGDQLSWVRLRWPRMFRERRQLMEWCNARKDEPLHKLQADMCEWAIKEITELDGRHGRAPHDRAISQIRLCAEQVTATGVPVIVREWEECDSENFTFCDEQEAEDISRRLRRPRPGATKRPTVTAP